MNWVIGLTILAVWWSIGMTGFFHYWRSEYTVSKQDLIFGIFVGGYLGIFAWPVGRFIHH